MKDKVEELRAEITRVIQEQGRKEPAGPTEYPPELVGRVAAYVREQLGKGRSLAECAQELGLPCAPAHARPFVHISGMFPTERGCIAIMWPLASHPTNKNELIAWDLAHDPTELASLDVATLRQRLFTRSADLPEGVARLPVKTVHLNKSPVVIGNLKVLTPALQARWGLDLDQALRHAATARGMLAASDPMLREEIDLLEEKVPRLLGLG